MRGKIAGDTHEKLKNGTELEDGPAKPDWVKIIKSDNESTTLELSFHEGRNHLVKRYFAKFGHPVTRLTRMSVGPVKLAGLERGRWRNLTDTELRELKRALEKGN